jgi:NADPH-dependent 2,4-dienoyl-CoA reductase/sulfur reductase-like enzyme
VVRVCVVGGGTAGSAAAMEAASKGAGVTVLERSERPDPPWRTWPDLIGPSQTAGDHSPARLGNRGSYAKCQTTEAKSVGPGFVVTTRKRREEFDFVIIATGSSFGPPTFQGSRKPGVFVLDSARAYSDLGRYWSAKAKAVVAGEGWRSLQVADRLGACDKEVRAFISHWQRGGPSPLVFNVIQGAARDRGVCIEMGNLERAAGSGDLEAAVAGGEVMSCDTLASIPRRIPRVVPASVPLGRSGGLPVDRRMKTTAPAIYAAGACAELDARPYPSVTLEWEALHSGRIAGSNCMGGRHGIGLVRFCELTMFGLRWSRMGIGAPAALALGFQAEVACRRWGDSTACVIVYEGTSERVLGIESVEAFDKRTAEVIPIESGVTLQTLAYGGLGSSDISLVSDTARLAL